MECTKGENDRLSVRRALQPVAVAVPVVMGRRCIAHCRKARRWTSMFVGLVGVDRWGKGNSSAGTLVGSCRSSCLGGRTALNHRTGHTSQPTAQAMHSTDDTGHWGTSVVSPVTLLPTLLPARRAGVLGARCVRCHRGGAALLCAHTSPPIRPHQVPVTRTALKMPCGPHC